MVDVKYSENITLLICPTSHIVFITGEFLMCKQVIGSIPSYVPQSELKSDFSGGCSVSEGPLYRIYLCHMVPLSPLSLFDKRKGNVKYSLILSHCNCYKQNYHSEGA